MIIKENMRALFANTLRGSGGAGTVYTSMPIRDIYGLRVYATSKNYDFPASANLTFSSSVTTGGISVGTGNTPATQDDYNLESTITSGLSVTVNSVKSQEDANGNPYIAITLSLTNTSAEAITIKEVGYKQAIKGGSYNTTNSNDIVCLIDRTVLENPLTIEPTDVAIIDYKLITYPYPEKYKNGVKLVPFRYGTDEEIVTCIQAAHNGLIDLHDDCGWGIGDSRTITVGAFTGYNDIANTEQNCEIMITSFEDYNNCGCVLQFDFNTPLNAGGTMNPTATNAGGYGACKIYEETLPALVAALPSWIKDNLITFSVEADGGNNTSVITVSNNKLALRSLTELVGVMANIYTEGTQIKYFGLNEYYYKRISGIYWTRTASMSGTLEWYVIRNSGSSHIITQWGNSGGISILPFGCL